MTQRVLHLDTGRLLRGGQRQVLMLMVALRERGWDSVLAAPMMGTLSRRARDEGFEVINFNPRNDLDLGAALRLGVTAERENLRLWHAHSSRAHGVARLGLSWPISARSRHRRRLVVTRRTAFISKSNPLKRLKYRDTRVESYIAISGAVSDRLQDLGIGEDRISLVPSAVDMRRFRSAAHTHFADTPEPTDHDPELRQRLRDELGVPEDGFLVGAAGALDRSKGFDILLQAASRACMDAPSLYFAVAGEGPQRATLLAELNRLGMAEHFRLLGRRKDVHRLFHAFDLFCMPSREEGLGSAVLEAFASGVPVLASDAGGLAELLHPGKTGSRVARDDVTALKEALVSICLNPEPARAMARQAWELAAGRFSVIGMAEAVERVYHSLDMNGGPTRNTATAGG
jgi:L-malate glycosyltransferase